MSIKETTGRATRDRRRAVGQPIRDRRRAERKVWASGLIASLLLHVLFVLAGGRRPIPESPFAAAGPDAGDDRAARGGLQALNVALRPPRPVRPAEIPLPVDVEIEPVEIDAEPVFDMAALLGDDPGPLGPPGLDDGDGEGAGGTAGEGLLQVLPPTPRGMIIPPANKKLRGVRVQVWVFVDEEGHVVPDSTRLNPPTRDRGFNRQLVREAAQWIFRPGTRDGEPVAAWFPYTVIM